jgi:hypothetical protein
MHDLRNVTILNSSDSRHHRLVAHRSLAETHLFAHSPPKQREQDNNGQRNAQKPQKDPTSKAHDVLQLLSVHPLMSSRKQHKQDDNGDGNTQEPQQDWHFQTPVRDFGVRADGHSNYHRGAGHPPLPRGLLQRRRRGELPSSRKPV